MRACVCAIGRAVLSALSLSVRRALSAGRLSTGRLSAGRLSAGRLSAGRQSAGRQSAGRTHVLHARVVTCDYMCLLPLSPLFLILLRAAARAART